MLGNAAIPIELWAVVLVGAFIAWGVSEGIARIVWKNVEAASRP
jgi:hypothetical protein